MFVASISHNRKAADILEAIVQLAGKLRMRTVAEGIETQDELDFIQSLGCSAGQGYYLGMPMARRDFIDYLEEASSGMLGHGVNSCAKSVATMRGGHDAIGIMSAAAHTRPAGNGAVVTESIKGAA
jgi:predicted signal transduction protein with EAL and GGDEF domain